MTQAQRERRQDGPVMGLCDGPDLVAALRSGKPAASAILFDRYAPRVQRILARVIGVDSELPDLLQEVFLRALENVERIDDPARIEAWLSAIAVHAARECLRRRTRQRWLSKLGLGERHAQPADVAGGEALAATYAVLEKLPADERIAFALRFVDGMELTAVAQACEVSLATIKRRLVKAERRFLSLASQQPALERWLSGGGRWTR
ncbi:MAG: sigma-70 family RNA polymerase sigma factor [Myxococcales bacterium]